MGIHPAENLLVLEDDAVPINPAWHDICCRAEKLLENFEYVSIHSRFCDRAELLNHCWYEKKCMEGIEYYVPKVKGLWVVATLAYLITPEAGEKILSWRYNGIPLDVQVYGKLNYCIIDPSPFQHDRSQGTLIE